MTARHEAVFDRGTKPYHPPSRDPVRERKCKAYLISQSNHPQPIRSSTKCYPWRAWDQGGGYWLHFRSTPPFISVQHFWRSFCSISIELKRNSHPDLTQPHSTTSRGGAMESKATRWKVKLK